jgi:hypothetical protein
MREAILAGGRQPGCLCLEHPRLLDKGGIYLWVKAQEALVDQVQQSGGVCERHTLLEGLY